MRAPTSQNMLGRSLTTNVRGANAARFRKLIREMKRKLVHIQLGPIWQITIIQAKPNSFTHPEEVDKERHQFVNNKIVIW